MKQSWRKGLAVCAASALATVAVLAGAGPASAVNECAATGAMNATYDHASTYQSAGTCKFHRIQGKWLLTASPGGDYFLEESKQNVGVGGTVYVGYTLSSVYQIVSYRACTDTVAYSCTLGSARTNTAGQVFP